SLVLSGPSWLSSLSQSGGTLAGTGVVTVTGSALFTNQNTQTGSGTTDVKGATTIGIAATGVSVYALTLDGGRTFQNDGTVGWIGGVIQTGLNQFSSTLG